ncbi:hypothetical protein D3C80_1863900 [compost metagenome]
MGALVFLYREMDLTLEAFVHPVAEHKHLGATGGSIAVGHHAIGILGLVNSHRHGRGGGNEQDTKNQQSREHGQSSVEEGLERSLAARTDPRCGQMFQMIVSTLCAGMPPGTLCAPA